MEVKPVRFAGPRPQCISEHDYKLWSEYQERTYSDASAVLCSDCTPDYQSKMRSLGLCENPHVVFRKTRSGQWRGITSPEAHG